jgi:hypothetical protein
MMLPLPPHYRLLPLLLLRIRHWLPLLPNYLLPRRCAQIRHWLPLAEETQTPTLRIR